jgi:predicted site-specific integrase-resolvase
VNSYGHFIVKQRHGNESVCEESRNQFTFDGNADYNLTLLQAQGRHIEAIFPTDTNDDLVNDFVRVFTSMTARICGGRKSNRRAEKMKQEENSPERQAIRTVSAGNSFQ